MDRKTKDLVKNTTILSFGTICTKGIMFLMTPLLTKWLSQSDYGTFDLLTTYITLFIPVITLDSGEAAFGFLMDADEDDKEKTSIVTNAFFVMIMGFGISGTAFVIAAALFPNLRSFMLAYFTLLVCEAVNTYNVFIVRGLKKITTYAVSNILFVVSIAGFSFVFVKFFQLGLNGILLSYSAGYVVSALYIAIYIGLRKFISFKAANSLKLKEMLKYSLPLIPAAVSWWIINASDRTIISSILGVSSNAIYAVANKVPNLCQVFYNAFHISWQENAVVALNDKNVDEYYSSVFNNMIKTVGSACVLILTCNFLLFHYFFIEEYFAAYYQVPILVLAVFFHSIAQFIGGIYVAKMDSKKNGTTTAIAAVINIVVHLALIKFIGLYAASISTLVAYVSLLLIRYKDIRLTVRLKFDLPSVVSLLVLIYFFVCNYVNVNWLNWANLALSAVYFVYCNHTYVEVVMKKIRTVKKG